jgi:hypothetical protein
MAQDQPAANRCPAGGSRAILGPPRGTTVAPPPAGKATAARCTRTQTQSV